MLLPGKKFDTTTIPAWLTKATPIMGGCGLLLLIISLLFSFYSLKVVMFIMFVPFLQTAILYYDVLRQWNKFRLPFKIVIPCIALMFIIVISSIIAESIFSNHILIDFITFSLLGGILIAILVSFVLVCFEFYHQTKVNRQEMDDLMENMYRKYYRTRRKIF